MDEEGFFDDEDVDDFFEDPADCEVECETEEVVCFTVSKRLSPTQIVSRRFLYLS